MWRDLLKRFHPSDSVLSGSEGLHHAEVLNHAEILPACLVVPDLKDRIKLNLYLKDRMGKTGLGSA